MYRIEVQARGVPGGSLFSAHVVLTNVRGGGERLLPVSSQHSAKMPARMEAALLALVEIMLEDEAPHDDIAPFALRLRASTGGGGGRGGGGGAEPVVLRLPTLEDGLFAAASVGQPLVRGHAAVGAAAPVAAAATEGHADEDSGDSAGEEEPGGASHVLHGYTASATPSNLGRLGEEYAAAWLARQPWVRAVRWLNRDAEAQRPFDLEVELREPRAQFPAARRCVEVKTLWRGVGRRTVSREQARRLEDASADFMVLHLGDFCNLFSAPRRPPAVQLLPGAVVRRPEKIDAWREWHEHMRAQT